MLLGPQHFLCGQVTRGLKEQQKTVEAERKAVMAEERATMEKLITTISGAVNRDLPGRIKEIVKQQVGDLPSVPIMNQPYG